MTQLAIESKIDWDNGATTKFRASAQTGIEQLSHTVAEGEPTKASITEHTAISIDPEDIEPISIAAPALINAPPSQLIGDTLSIQVEPPGKQNPYEDLYLIVGDAVNHETNQVTNRVGQGSRGMAAGVYANRFTELPTDGRALWVEVAVIAEAPSNGSNAAEEQMVERALIAFTAHKADESAAKSVPARTVNGAHSVHMGAGKLIDKPPMVIQNPKEPYRFKGVKDQTVHDFEYHAPKGSKGDRGKGLRRGFAINCKSVKFQRFFITSAEDMTDFSRLPESTPFQMWKCENMQIEDMWCRGGKFAFNAAQCAGTQIDGTVLWAGARHSLILGHERPYKGKMGYVDGLIAYPYTHDEFRARGLRVSNGADIVNIHQAYYNGDDDPFEVRNWMVVGAHGKNGSQLIQDGGDYKFGKTPGGGVLFKNGALIGACKIAASDAGGVGAKYENIMIWRHPDMPGGRELSGNSGPFVWFDFGRPYPDPKRSPAPLKNEKDMKRSAGYIKNVRAAYHGNNGKLIGWNGRDANGKGGFFPNPGEKTRYGRDEGRGQRARYYGHPKSCAPKIIDSNLMDADLTLGEAWDHGLECVKNVNVFEDKKYIELTEWWQYAQANRGKK